MIKAILSLNFCCINMFFAVDVGGTKIRVAGFDTLNETVADNKQFLPTTNDYEKDFNNIEKSIVEIAKGAKIDAIGIGIGAPLNLNRNSIASTRKLGGWIGKNITRDFESKFDVPIFLENDAVAAAMAEEKHSENLRAMEFLFVIWGTGVGGAYVFRDHQNKSTIRHSEIGHSIISPSGDLCGCGQRGCLETFCGGANILEKYGVPAESLPEERWEEIVDAFGTGLAGLQAVLDVDAVIFGGGIANKRRDLIPRIQKSVAEKLRIVSPPVIFAPSKFSEDNGLIGALNLINI